MIKLFKAALVVTVIAGFQIAGSVGASASETGLLQYAKVPTVNEVTQFKPIKVASKRSRRRNKVIGGVVAAGVAGLIISEAIRAERHRNGYDEYDDDRVYNDRSSYPGRNICRKWNRRCDRGVRKACRKWSRRCR